MKVDICGNKILESWNGSNCSIIFDKNGFIIDSDFRNYIKECPIDSKGRMHYYVKSYFISKILYESGIENVFHIGFAKERYLYSYKYHGIKNIIACDINLSKDDVVKWNKKYGMVFSQDFFAMGDNFLKLIEQNDVSKSAVITEATFYWLCNYKYNNWNRHIKQYAELSENKIEHLHGQFAEIIKTIREKGYSNFIFVEMEHPMFKNVFNDLQYSMVQMGENFKYDFMVDYVNYMWTVAHIYSNGLLGQKAKILET